MRLARDLALGLVLAVLSWALLELTQYAWWATTSQGARQPLFEAIVLVAAGGALMLVALSRVVRASAAVVAALLLAILLAPVVLGLGAWWPRALPGSAERLASFPGTYLTVGMWLAVGASKWGPLRGRHGAGSRRATDHGAGSRRATDRGAG